MKRYLLVGIALLFVSANASLKEDFAQMDLAEEELLSDMRKSVTLSGDIDEEDEVKEDAGASESIEESNPGSKEEVLAPSPESTENMAESVGAVTSELDSVVNEDDSEERADAIRQKAMDEAKEKDKAEKVSAAKEEALEKEIVAKAAEIKKVKEAKEEAAVQRAAEKREVEAYEKQRAEKLAKEAATKAAQKAELEKKQLAQKALDKAASKEKSMNKTSVEETKEVVIAVGDVNISRELEEKIQAANEEYENAVKEMQVED